jgi:glycerol-3-phosphate dehydrogenase
MSTTRPEINLHPTSHPISSLSFKIYDVIVIGAGPAGEMTAQRCVRGGLTVRLLPYLDLTLASFLC